MGTRLKNVAIVSLDGVELTIERPPTAEQTARMRNDEAVKRTEIEVVANVVTVARSLIRAVKIGTVGEAEDYGEMYKRMLALNEKARTVEFDEADLKRIVDQLDAQAARFGLNAFAIAEAFKDEAPARASRSKSDD